MKKSITCLKNVQKIIFIFFVLVGIVPVGAQSFNHPGILNNQVELNFIKNKIKKGEQPWKNAFEVLKVSKYSSLTYTARPKATTDCGSYNKDKYGNTVPECKTFVEDAMAAYSASLMWYFTEDKRYAAQAIKLINAWSNVYVSNEGSNARLNVAWAAPWYTNAAELLKYGNSNGTAGWSTTEMQKFDLMLNKFLPYIKDETMPGNNWIQSAIEAHFAIAIYTNNRTEFNSAVSRWKTRVKTYIYQKTDGPISTKFKSAPIDGICMETARDLGHMKLGINSMLYAAQSAFEQGVDLFSLEQKRLSDCLELHGSWMTGSVAVPSNVNGGLVVTRENQPSTAVKPPNGGGATAFEIAYNHLGSRLKRNMPYTKQMINGNRPASAGQWVFKWETLTHGNLPFSFTPADPCANNSLPVTSITAPSANTTFEAGTNIVISANASDNGSITEVEFFNGTVSLGKDNSQPYTITLTNAAANSYSIKVVATDNCGGKTTSGVIAITVNPKIITTIPQVSFIKPLSNAQFNSGSSIVVNVNATDIDGIANVKLYLNGVFVRQESTAPYDWNHNGQDVALQNMAAGTYTLKAVATDSKGTLGEASINITVKSITVDPCAGIVKPTVSITSPSVNSIYNEGQAITISTNTTSLTTISKVDFYNGTNLVYSDNSAPYIFSTSTLLAGTYSLLAKVTDNCGNSVTSSAVPITVKKVGVMSNDPILGASCGSKLQTVSFELNPSYTTNATGYSWWFSGSSDAVTPSVDGKKATVTLSKYFSTGEVCVGVNLTNTPYYIQYCKPITNCSARIGINEEINNSEILNNKLMVYPNPSNGSFLTIDANGLGENLNRVQVINSLGDIVIDLITTSNATTLSIDGLSNGTYNVKTFFKNSSMIKKLVIVK